MSLLDFINRLLGLQKPSASEAKQRLQLVLAHDRSDLNPELLEQMRKEILEVVQKYVEIDLESGDVSLATEDRVTALVANLPIRRARAFPLVKDTETAGLAGASRDAAPPANEIIGVPGTSTAIHSEVQASETTAAVPLEDPSSESDVGSPPIA